MFFQIDNQIHNQNKLKGFGIIELVISLALLGLFIGVMGAFARDVFYFNNVLQTGIVNVSEARKILRPFVGEVRKAGQSDAGAFVIYSAATSSFSFFTDVDEDGSRERVRYFLDGTVFKKGVIYATGSPVVYNEGDENIIQVVQDVVPASTTFLYFDTNYNGASTSVPLSFPVTTTDIRLVRIDLTIDANPERAPSLITVTSQATIRNMKDNHDAE